MRNRCGWWRRFIFKRARNFLPGRRESLYHEAMKAHSRSSAVLLLCVIGFVAVSSVGAQTITVSAAPSVITNAGDETTLTLTISPPSPRRLEVQFFLSGTAAYGSDYILVGQFNRAGRFIVPAGQSTATITVHSFYDDDRPGTEESVIFTLHNGRKYRVGSPSRAEVTIENID